MIFTYVSALVGPRVHIEDHFPDRIGIAFLVVRIKLKGELFDYKNSDRPEIRKY